VTAYGGKTTNKVRGERTLGRIYSVMFLILPALACDAVVPPLPDTHYDVLIRRAAEE